MTSLTSNTIENPEEHIGSLKSAVPLPYRRTEEAKSDIQIMFLSMYSVHARGSSRYRGGHPFLPNPCPHFGSGVFFSFVIHSRMYGEQCLSSVPFVSH